MISNYSYLFSELVIQNSDIATLLGYPEGVLPEPFSDYLAEALKEAEILCDIRGAIYSTNEICFSEGKDSLRVEDRNFLIGKTVARELRNSESMVCFICTAGKGISERSQQLLMGDDPVLGYVYDVLGSVIVEAAINRIHQEIKTSAIKNSMSVTNRYSPGFCQWSVADQHRLFSFFPENCCGINLTDSALMYPIKSVSGIIGVGKNVKFREYTCNLCNLTSCFYRNLH